VIFLSGIHNKFWIHWINTFVSYFLCLIFLFTFVEFFTFLPNPLLKKKKIHLWFVWISNSLSYPVLIPPILVCWIILQVSEDIKWFLFLKFFSLLFLWVALFLPVCYSFNFNFLFLFAGASHTLTIYYTSELHPQPSSFMIQPFVTYLVLFYYIFT
jgi:hypothetical protein